MAFPITIVYCDDLRKEVIFSPNDIPVRKAFTVVDTYDSSEEKLVTITRDNWKTLPKVLPYGTLIYLPRVKNWSETSASTGRSIGGIKMKDESMELWLGIILRIPK